MIADAIKVKALSVITIVLLTLSLMGGLVVYNQHRHIQDNDREIASLNSLKSIQDETIKNLRADLESKPKQYIKVVREVDKTLCDTKTTADKVLSLGNKKEIVDETVSEKGAVDIDGRLPSDLIQLLK